MSNFRIRNGGSVFFTYIKGPLPEGNNHIGSVDISGGISNGYVTVSGPLPTGYNHIGSVDISGGSVVVDLSSLNIGYVTVSGPLPAGNNHIGSVDISGGISNGYVTVSGPLPTGYNHIGSVDISGGISNGYVTVSGPLPTGYNHIGSVSIDGSGTTITADISSYNPLYFQNSNSVIGKVILADSSNLDGFSRLRVSNPETLFDGPMIDSSNSQIFDISTNGGAIATYNKNESVMTFDVSRSGQFVKRQSHYFARYQPGKSLLCYLSFYFGSTCPVGISKRVGLFEDNQGIYFEQTSTGVSWNMRSTTQGTTLSVPQSSWNIDILNGTGPSGFTFNVNQTNLCVIDLEWLGVGRVRVGFIIEGKIIYCHQFVINNLTFPYIRSAYLPLRYEIQSSQNQAQSISMKQICCTMISEGGYSPIGLIRSYLMESFRGLNSTSFTPVLSIRLNSQFKSLMIIPENFTILFPAGNQTLFVKIIYRGALTGANFTDYNDIVQIDTSATGISGGFVVDSTYITNQSRISFQEIPSSVKFLQSDINGVCDIMSICVKSSSGTPDIYCASNWREIL
jgi:hypothetical protein